MYGVHDVRVETVPDARIVEDTDALVRVTRACICGSDLWPYNSMPASTTGNRMGHEFIGVVESIGTDVRTVKKGDLVVAPFGWSDGTCEFCQQDLQTSCLLAFRWGPVSQHGVGDSLEVSSRSPCRCLHRQAVVHCEDEMRERVSVRSCREVSCCHSTVETFAEERVAFGALGCELAA